jgi:hypothetical protein
VRQDNVHVYVFISASGGRAFWEAGIERGGGVRHCRTKFARFMLYGIEGSIVDTRR